MCHKKVLERLEPVLLDRHSAVGTGPGGYEVRGDARRFESWDPRLVAHDEAGGVVGLADAGPARDPDMVGIPELYRIYTLSRTHGSGLGAKLMEAAIGDTPAYLWVLEDNPRARAFCRKSGFSPDGARKVLARDWGELPEIRLVRC